MRCTCGVCVVVEGLGARAVPDAFTTRVTMEASRVRVRRRLLQQSGDSRDVGTEEVEEDGGSGGWSDREASNTPSLFPSTAAHSIPTPLSSFSPSSPSLSVVFTR